MAGRWPSLSLSVTGDGDGDGDGIAVFFKEAMYTLWISELRGLHNMNVAG